MWRVRSIMVLLMLYFFWSAVFSHSDSVFGYSKQLMLTYILGSSVLRALVLSSRSIDISAEISTGDLSSYLLKPLNYLHYWFVRDLADKFLNILFVVLELGIIVWLFKPPLFFSLEIEKCMAFLIASFLAMPLFFYLSLLISMTTFWYAEHTGWPARFLFQLVLEFIAGGLFPLDILPKPAFLIAKFLPTTYLLFFPLQVWLGRIQGIGFFVGIGIMVAWILILGKLTGFVWKKGLKTYEAYGQ